MSLKTVVFWAAICAVQVVSAQQYLDMKMEVAVVDLASHSIFVDLSVRYHSTGAVYLGDQNYRLYFDSKNLSFDKGDALLLLPRDRYSEVIILESIAHRDAAFSGHLPYDEDLGFVNLRVDLLDDSRGGYPIERDLGWLPVVRLKFDVKDLSKPCLADWSHKLVTRQYATAYVEITEWQGPNKARPFVIDEVHNLNFALWLDNPGTHISVSPNPAVDHLKIAFGSLAEKTFHIKVTNAAGSMVLKTTKDEGIGDVEFPVSHWVPAGYNIEIYDDRYHRIHNESVVVTR